MDIVFQWRRKLEDSLLSASERRSKHSAVQMKCSGNCVCEDGNAKLEHSGRR